MEKVKVLYVSQEIMPFLPESEISSKVRKLAPAMQNKGREVRVFMPRFGCINERRNQLHEVIRLSGMNLIIDDMDHPLIIKVASIPQARVQVYFIDNDEYFSRKVTLQESEGTYCPDNDERAMFFVRGVLETVKKLGWAPDIIHCNGWFTSLMPLYIKRKYNDDPHFADSRVVYSAYEDNFEGSLDPRLAEKLVMNGFSEEDVAMIKEPTFENFNKLGMHFSDGIIKGSAELEPGVESYINDTKKPHLAYEEDQDYVKSYSEFYDTVLNESPILID